MRERTLPERMAAARTSVRAARVLLARPRTCSLDRCATLLCEAHGELEGLRDGLRSGSPGGRGLRAEALALGREIRCAGALLEQAARFGRHWLERWCAHDSGYTPAGVPEPIAPKKQISVLG